MTLWILFPNGALLYLCMNTSLRKSWNSLSSCPLFAKSSYETSIIMSLALGAPPSDPHSNSHLRLPNFSILNFYDLAILIVRIEPFPWRPPLCDEKDSEDWSLSCCAVFGFELLIGWWSSPPKSRCILTDSWFLFEHSVEYLTNFGQFRRLVYEFIHSTSKAPLGLALMCHGR